jgi:hypothetical protein
MKIKYPPIKGNLKAWHWNDEGVMNVAISGDPKGLKSLANLVIQLANVNQKKLKSLPARFSSEHIHLEPNLDLAQNSARLCIDRADDKTGKLDPTFSKRKKPRTRVIVHLW